MEGKCQELFEKVAKIHSIASVVVQTWDSRQIGPERRQESIDRLRARGVELSERHVVRSKDINTYFDLLDTMERYNKGEDVKVGMLVPGNVLLDFEETVEKITSDMAIHAIADCECARNILKPLNPNEELR